MKKISKDRRHYNMCKSEIKCKDNLKDYKTIKAIIKSENNKNPHFMCFHLIKCFFENKLKSLTNDDLINYIINVFKNNPKALMTSTKEEEFKNEKGIKTSYTKLINKSIIFIYNSRERKYKLNAKEAISYLKSIINYNFDRQRYKTPIKLVSKTKRLNSLYREKNNFRSPQSLSKGIFGNKIKKEKNESDEESSEEENIKIKKEEINIKEEKYNSSEESITIKKEEIKIKEEPIKIKEEQNFEEENLESDDLNLDKILELLNAKLYDDNFYHSFAEQGIYEQLQEKLEIILDNYNKNISIKEKNIDILNEIKQIQEYLEDLNKSKEVYDNLISEYGNIKKNINFFAQILKFKYHEIKYSKEIMENEEYSNYQMDIAAKDIYDFYKEKHDFTYKELINNHKKIKNAMENSEKKKELIKNNFIKIVDKIDFNNFGMTFINHLNELVKNIKSESYSFFVGEIVAEQAFQKYNKYIKELDKKTNNLFNPENS